MNAPLTLYLPTAAALTIAGCADSSNEQAGHDDHDHDHEHTELAEPMAQLHYYSQKLGYSVQAQNTELADFYLHELEELSREIQREIPEYEGHQIGDLTDQLLMPAIETSENALDSGDWDETWQQYERLINTCNSCHQATEHAFIVITPAEGDPPFNQEFELPGP